MDELKLKKNLTESQSNYTYNKLNNKESNKESNIENNIENNIDDKSTINIPFAKSQIQKTSKSNTSLVLSYIFNKNLQNIFQKIIGNYYVWLHIGIMTFGIYIILFSMNQLALLFVIVILAIDAFTIVILHDCPLTMLERYYIKHSSVYWRLNSLRNSGIKYSLENEYDIQLEVVINGAAMAIFKLFCIIVLQSKPFI